MLNAMIAARIKNLLVAIVVSAGSCSAQAEESGSKFRSRCLVTEKDAEGAWSASRNLLVRNGVVSSAIDSYEWRAKESATFAPGATLKWGVGYDWSSQEALQKAIPEDRVLVILNFWYDAERVDTPMKRPDNSWIHLYRSANPEERFSSNTTSLTGVMSWSQFNNGNVSATAVIELDHFLAFGAGFDKLVWNIRTAPDEIGATYALAKGVVPVSTMRNKVSQISKLRRVLDKKAANFQAECNGDEPPIEVDLGSGSR
ncbi:hypothetical protein [Pseudomonas sp. CGJS7]|uniref:hypothetical protein n=1 Tax=Pseudomonas sp. CGJS7 TaxID=3109348 RepID=UPI00300A10F1